MFVERILVLLSLQHQSRAAAKKHTVLGVLPGVGSGSVMAFVPGRLQERLGLRCILVHLPHYSASAKRNACRWASTTCSPHNDMKAAVYQEFGGPIRVQQVPRPVCPPDGILVQVRATGVCRSDWHGWKGHDSDIVEHGLPFIPGHEFAGTVAERGADVKRKFGVGDRVVAPFILSCGTCSYCQKNRPTVCSSQQQPGFTLQGSFAEYVAIPRADRNVQNIPPNVSFVQAAALGCRFTTAYRAMMEQGDWPNRDCVAVFGSGGVGLCCIMIAAAQGNGRPIIAVDISEAALHQAKKLGASHTILAEPGKELETRQKVKAILPDGADLTVDAAGFPATCENAIHCTQPAGRMVQVGLPIGGRAPEIPMGLIAGKEIEIFGSHGFSTDTMEDLLSMVNRGNLDPSTLIGDKVTLSEGAKTLEAMDTISPTGVTMITEFV